MNQVEGNIIQSQTTLARTGAMFDVDIDEILRVRDDERIVCAAVNINNVIYLGVRHADCYADYFRQICRNERFVPDTAIEGFITSRNKFVDRREAFKIAKQQNQIIHNPFNSSEELLYSEYLY